MLRGLGDNGLVTSICARNPTDVQAQDFGYRPAMEALVTALRNTVH